MWRGWGYKPFPLSLLPKFPSLPPDVRQQLDAEQNILPSLSTGAMPARFDDAYAQQIMSVWSAAFADAAPLPGIGLPSQNNGVLTFTHTVDPALVKLHPLSINGLSSRSPLSNNALGSVEVSDGHWLCLYETMLPDIPGSNGASSSGQTYVNALKRNDIDVAGNHYHWSGAKMMGYFPVAIHSQAVDLDPIEFAHRHLQAMRRALGSLAPPRLRQATGG
jgi:hypothetical protein